MCALQELQLRTDQVFNMATVMYRAALIEDTSALLTTERISRLEFENRHLRELLQFSVPLAYPNDRIQPNMEQRKEETAPTQQDMASRSTPVFGSTPSPPSMGSSDCRILNSNSVDLDSRSSTPQAIEYTEGEQGTLDRLTFAEDR